MQSSVDHHPPVALDQLRDALVALYQYRSYSLPLYAARMRLYGDAFADALVKQGYLQGELSVSQLYWLPRCIALHDLGRLTGVQGSLQIASQGLVMLERCEVIWGRRPYGDCLRSIVASFYENWQGDGLPVGMSGTEIPLAARIARIVASYTYQLPEHRLTDPGAHEAALACLHNASGQLVDAGLCELFLSLDAQLLFLNRDIQSAHLTVADCA